jgi:hypothetical protein
MPLLARSRIRPGSWCCGGLCGDTTERLETLGGGGGRLVGPEALVDAVAEVLAGGWPRAVLPPLWDARVGERMGASLAGFLAGLPAR